MKCKFCQGDMEPGEKLCPHCGKEAAQEEEIREEAAQEEAVQEEAVQEEVRETVKASAPMDKTKLVLAICAIVAVALLGVGLIAITLFGIKGGWEELSTKQTTPSVTTTSPETTPEPTEYVPGEGVLQYQSYTVSDDDAIAKGQDVVATVGEYSLTNRQAQMYYWMQFYDAWSYFYSQYGEYTAYMIGLDLTQPLDAQVCPDGTMSWQQYLLSSGLNTWQRYQVLNALAEDAGYTVTDEIRKVLDETRTSMEAAAQEQGVSVDELVADEMGAGVTLEDYLEYLMLYRVGMDYFEDLYDQYDPTAAEMDAYFTENQETMEASGITKESGNIADVRHILVMPEGGTEVEGSQYKSYTDDEWAACLNEAQKILDEWIQGGATEELFIELTGKYTEDGGYATNGGLYTNITATSRYVESFRAWAISPERKAGDCEIVQTEYGYHIMYLVSSDIAWERIARENLRIERCSQIVDEAVEQHPMEIDYSKIGLAQVTFG